MKYGFFYGDSRAILLMSHSFTSLRSSLPSFILTIHHVFQEEFVEALSLPSVQGFLQSMDVNIRDTGPLFEILDDGDGHLSIAEFCKGLLQLKGMARALDIIVLQRENAKVLRECQEMHSHLTKSFTLRS